MIRNATLTDFDLFYFLYMHPDINPFLLYEQMNKADFYPVYMDLLAQGVLYLFLEGDTPTGMFKLVPLHHRTNHIAYLGGVAVHPDHSGKGVGLAMMQAIVEFARQRGILRIELSTSTANERAIRLYEKVGFEPEGVLRRYTHLKSEGRFLDELLMSKIFI
jgi:L-phenylalanine/L-methionine N-acetyltransferase